MKSLLCLAAALGGPLVHGVVASPPVNVWLQTSWNSTNLLAEIIETAALEDPSTFFPLLDLLVSPTANPPSLTPLLKLTPKEIYEKSIQAIQKAKLLSKPGALHAFERALALRSASPRIAAFHSYYTSKHENEKLAKDCESWVEWYGKRLCTPDEVYAELGYTCPAFTTVGGHRVCAADEIVKGDVSHGFNPHTGTSASLTFDHAYPPLEQDSHLQSAILYGSFESSNFYSLHESLYRIAKRSESNVRYVFRHIPSSSSVENKAYLTGYGVALDLKKTDYLAVDDRKKRANNAGESQSVLSQASSTTEDPILSLLSPASESEPHNSVPLTADELTALGFKASELIITSPNPLSTLKHLTQNFPVYAPSLSRRMNMSDEIILALGGNMRKVQSGKDMLWLNGKPVQAPDVNPFGLLRLMRGERKVVEMLTNAGLSSTEALQVLTHAALSKPSASQVLEGMFDANDRQEGGDLIVWLNDLETEERYQKWPFELSTLMQPAYGGSMSPVRRNAYNVILALDLSKASSVATVSVVSSFIQRGLPLRMGIVPIVESDEAAKIAKVFYYLSQQVDALQALGIYAQAADHRRPTVELDAIAKVYAYVSSTEVTKDGDYWRDFEDIIAGDSAIIRRLTAYAERLAITNESSKGGHVFVNGKYMTLNDDWLRGLQTEVQAQTEYYREALFAGEMIDSKEFDVSTYFYTLPTTASRRNAYIYPSTSGASGLKIFPIEELGLPQRFIYHPQSQRSPLSMWIVGDLDSAGAIQLVQEALSSMSAASSYRLSFMHIPNPTSTRTPKISSALIDAMYSADQLKTTDFMDLLEGLLESDSVIDEILSKFRGSSKAVTVEQVTKLEKAGKLLGVKLGFKSGEVGIIVNGRVVGPIAPGAFTAADFHSLASYERVKRVQPVQEALDDVIAADDTERVATDSMLAKVSSIILADQQPDPGMEGNPTPRSRPYEQLTAENATFAIGNNETAIYHFALILNPTSDTSQRYASLLEWLSDDELVHAVVYLNPPTQVEEMPLKRYYRYNLQPRLSFENGELASAKASFENLPVEPLYTLAMDVPQSWLVRPHESLHDLDNIQLASLNTDEQTEGVSAVFSLDYLVIEGHARDAVLRSPPRGLQLQLTSGGTPIADTQVVANLGYFQLKAKPGIFDLEIRPGRGREIFEMTSAGNAGWESPSVEEAGVAITVASFEGTVLYPLFERLEGMENADVLEDSESESSGLFGSIASKVGSVFGGSKTTEVVKRQADINIFTVASGLLYERFASIMILSVLKNTDKTVKFWFIENFLSPSFLEFIPHFAEEYNFEYELVTYKWPSWLRMPTEKQRIIWGYKILFLDVLFPMDLKKVIFVDADQIVRADLHELTTINLNGAPYGYTPMGDDSHDMDGFRFWKQGYWKDHLQGRPYHISALYVVDLVRFRQLAAGDRLRGQYQGLSADPASLANLDQDLPNNMWREVPIFSLDEDWLWCETWCSKDRLHRAKTIDLCQNPKTKEPKLSRARQIPEWEKYDAEIASFAKRLAGSGRIRSSAAAENVDALAGEAPPAATAGKPSHVEL